ncbi:deoxyribonuclease IV [Aquibacillus halophilus]|uniref:Deoxyribonuclease IV n=1 Tax=Aquibacillus halophilus TaxID=930132 RepID=A0A6A8D9U6_9BACI|nr:deoxyribonuclease IV [Aquibacillus halophilus]MRH42525.1 deoxyribonuclease IV [Aquibacillus halophilus]
MKFGCHVSIKNGYLGAAEHACKINATAFQYFPKNPRSLSVKGFNEIDTKLCKEYCQKNKIVSVSHSPYPTNLTADKGKVDLVVASLLNDLAISDSCGSVGVIVHFGKSIDKNNPLISYQLMIKTLNNVLKEWKGKCKILLENSAGKTGTMGTSIEELVQIRKLSDFPDKIGFCFDTCHAFSSGLWNGENWEEVLDGGMELGYFNHLEVIHLNNSRYPTGSGKDRHANIFNHGYITNRQWEDIMGTKQIRHIPFILETPDDYGVTHREEIALLNKKWN